MKYSILGFNQEKVMSIQDENSKGMDVLDLFIVKWISDLFSRSTSIKMQVDDNYLVWVDYKTLLEDLPILGIKKRALQERLQRLVSIGVLTHYHDNEGGSFSYYGTTPMFDTLLYENEEGGYAAKCTGGMQQNAHHKPNTIKPTIKKENIKKEKYGEFVTLSGEEYSKLTNEYGLEATTKMIEILDNYKGSSGRQYKSDFRAILAWVVERYHQTPINSNKVPQMGKKASDLFR